MKKSIFILACGLLTMPFVSKAQSNAVAKDSPSIIAWAAGVEVNRDAEVTYGKPYDAVGVADTGNLVCVSLGNGGSALVTFDRPIKNGEGLDFVVFENAFGDTFLELAFVEVSSDGVNFFRFPAKSTATESDMAASNYYNLAGNTDYHYGTGFDLAELADDPNLDKNNIRLVRIVDVISGVSKDADGNIIYDPVTNGYSAGFDLTGVGIINAGIPYTIANMENLLSQANSYELPSADNSDITVADGSKHKNYISSDLVFPGVVEPTYQMAIGWGLSNITNTASATPTSVSGTGYNNDYYASAAMSGVDGEGKVYLQGYYSSYNSEEHMAVYRNDNKAFTPMGVYVSQSNSSFTYSSEQADLWFKVVATGYDAQGNKGESTELYLIDKRDGGVGNLGDWRWMDLASLGEVSKILFSLETNDATYYIPMYLCIDNFVYDFKNGNATEDVYTLNVNMYPNPAKDFVTINVNGEATAQLCDVQGRVIAAAESENNTITFNNLTSGMYFVKINTADSQVVKKLIVK